MWLLLVMNVAAISVGLESDAKQRGGVTSANQARARGPSSLRM